MKTLVYYCPNAPRAQRYHGRLLHGDGTIHPVHFAAADSDEAARLATQWWADAVATEARKVALAATRKAAIGN